MDIPTIKTRIDALKKLFPDPSQDTIELKELIILRYSQSVLNKLEEIIYEKKVFQEASFDLQSFLSRNWGFVKDNLLCYTALPRHDITEFLCDMALWIAEFESKPDKPLSAINVLMPTIRCDSLNLKRYPNLDEIDLKKVLQTHILGSNHHYLVPISLLTRIEKNKDRPDAKISNPYFDVFIHEKDPALSPVFLNDKDIKRLYQHSESTKAIGEAICHYQLSINQSSLLKQLQTLIHGLEYNSVRGTGKEESAATGGYNALITFMDFWHLLSDQLAVVPQELIKEINFLKQLTTDPEQNTKFSIKTCLATRRDALFKKIAGHEKILNAITVSNEKKENLIQENIQRLKKSLNNMAFHLQNGNYVGQDRFGITITLLTKLKIPLELADYEAVAFVLKEMKLEEVPHFCALKEVEEKMAEIFCNLDDFILLSDLINDTLFALFLQALQQRFQELVRSNKNLLAVLKHINPNHYIAVYETLKEKLFSIVKSASEFSVILKYLSPPRKTAVCQIFNELFVLTIKNTEDFLTLYLSLEPSQQTFLYLLLKERWHSIIQTNHEFYAVFHRLSAEQKVILYEIFKEHLALIIKDTRDFLTLYLSLESNQQVALCHSLKEHWHSIINTADEFLRIVFYLSAEQKIILYDAFKVQLPALVKHSKNWILISYLDYSQSTSLCNIFKEHWPPNIKSTSDLCELLSYLPFEKCSKERILLCRSLKEEWSRIIKNHWDLKGLLTQLQPTEQILVLEPLQTHGDLILKNPEDFKRVISSLASDERIILCAYLETQWPSLIKNLSDFTRVFYLLEPPQRVALCESFKTHWPSIIKTSNDFDKILNHLTQINEQSLLCESLAGHWSYIIKEARDFGVILSKLSHRQYAALCDALKDHLPSIIKTHEDLSTVFHYMNSQKKEVLLTSLKKHFPMRNKPEQPSQTAHFPASKPSTFRFFSRIFQAQKHPYFGQRFHPAPRP